jgi:hypothetical protein
MALTIHLRPDVNARLREEAARLGKAEEEVVADIIDRSLPITEEPVKVPKRPDPTPEQAALGILPAAIGNGAEADVDAWMRYAPHFDGTDDEFEVFNAAIAENRATRRQLASQKNS